jgi:glycosyltransferase involved in cell wall biosynthesis
MGRDCEFVVVDNASGDQTRKVVLAFSERSPIPAVYIREERLGHSFALNAGIMGCRGDIIAFTDDDAIPANDWLLRIDSTFREYDADIVFGRVTPCWETNPPAWFSDRHRAKFALLDYGPEPFVVADLGHPFVGVNHAVHRRAMEKLGGYREDRGARGQEGAAGNDTDLFERALTAGMRIVYDPRIVVQHVIPACRCTKHYYRRLTWRSRKLYHSYVMDKEKELPRLGGLPRYRFRMAAGTLIKYVMNIIKSNKQESFQNELDMLKFICLVVESRGKGRGSARNG